MNTESDDDAQRKILDKAFEQAMKELRIERQPVCVNDGVDAPYVVFLQENEFECATDEQGRVKHLAVWATEDNPIRVDDVLQRVSSLRHVETLAVRGWEEGVPTDRFVSDDGLQHIADWSCLKLLRFETHRVTGDAFSRLADGNMLRGLVELDIAHVDNADAMLCGLAAAPAESMQKLRISDCGVTDAGVAAIGTLSQLQEVEVLSTKVTGVGFARLAHLTTLRRISVEGCPVTDEGLLGIARCQSIERLAVEGSAVTDQGLKEMGRLPSLRMLFLRNTRLTLAGLQSIQEGCPRLESLSLCDSNIYDDAIPILAQMKRLNDVYLLGTGLTKAGARRLIKELPSSKVRVWNDGWPNGIESAQREC